MAIRKLLLLSGIEMNKNHVVNLLWSLIKQYYVLYHTAICFCKPLNLKILVEILKLLN